MVLLEIWSWPAPCRLGPKPHGGCHGQISSDLTDLQGLQKVPREAGITDWTLNMFSKKTYAGLRRNWHLRIWAVCKPSWTAPKWANQLSYSLGAYQLASTGFKLLVSWQLQHQSGLSRLSPSLARLGAAFPRCMAHDALPGTFKMSMIMPPTQRRKTRKNMRNDVKMPCSTCQFHHGYLVTFHLFTASWHLEDAILQGIQVREAAAIVLA